MLISQSEAARIIGVSRQYIDEWRHKKPRPSYFTQDEKNIWRINDESPQWIAMVEKYACKQEQKEKKQKGTGKIKNVTVDGKVREAARKAAKEILSKEKELDIYAKSNLAIAEKKIYQNEIAKQQALQEEIRTLELKKVVADMGLFKYWWSFTQSLIERIYRRPHEIEPELAALFMAGENKQATQKLIRELEVIIKDVTHELYMDINNEGYNMPEKGDEKNNNDV
jgi:transcriptional regulator with XRE-family HTH domain